MNDDRQVVVALTDGSADLGRYAALVARLNARAGRIERGGGRAVAKRGELPATSMEPPTEHDPVSMMTADGEELLLTAPQSVRFVHIGGGLDEVPHDRAADHLLRLANEGTDVIMIGEERTRGRRLARRLLHEANCSIWLAPPAAPLTMRRILVPVDFSTRCADSLRVACALARLSGVAECLALHVHFDDSILHGHAHDRKELERLTDAYARFMAGIDSLGVPVRPLFREGSDPARSILRAAHETEADLIVMSSRGRTRAAALLLESVPDQVLRETSSPLLVVKHFGARLGLLQALRQLAVQGAGNLRFR